MKRTGFSIPIGLVLAGLALACSPQQAADEPGDLSGGDRPADRSFDDDVVAAWRDGVLTAEELDQAILALPPAERQSLRLQDGDSGREGFTSLHDFARELAVDEILLREAKLLGIDQGPEFVYQLRGLRRNAIVEHFLATHLPPTELPTEAELRQAFARQEAATRRVERRFVYNIFRRVTPESPREDLVADLEAVREQITSGQVSGGQGFGALAERISDSESRHNKGQLGWFERGQLSPQLEAVVFALEEGMPSEPIATRDGVHLFLVDVVVDAKNFTFDEMRKSLEASHLAEDRAEAVGALAGDLEADRDVFITTADELEALHRRGDPSAVVLRVGDFQLRFGQLVSMVAASKTQQPGALESRPMQILESLRKAELIYQHRLAAPEPVDAELQGRLAIERDRLLALFYRQRKLEQKIESEPGTVRAFFDANRKRFTSPLELRLDRLSVPLDRARAPQQMARLEQLRAELDAGTLDLAEAAREVGGTVESLGLLSLAELKARDPKLASFAPEVAVGHHSPPYSTPTTLEMLKLVERREPEPISFEAARERARVAYLERNGQRLYESMREQLLEDAGFRFLDPRLDRFVGIEAADGPKRTRP